MLTLACFLICDLLISFLLHFFTFFFFFFNDTATTEIYTLSLHDALPIWTAWTSDRIPMCRCAGFRCRSEEHTSELQSLRHLVCRLLLEKKKKTKINQTNITHKERRRQSWLAQDIH